ncbi:hypothetical protein QPL78_03770 [Bacillus halotolerans]|uniref:hypothetical protein n=1 Tax=Bacillus halotolerans TaxID=260554 RepID=UPI00254242F8|nr:hypothetical protein [Bacillus halotolerans]WIG47658.1 hypothetical protein QPL78_03770 [Bacillus halotolerans]
MDKDFLIIKIKDIQKGDTLTNRACGNWDMKLSRAKECKRAIVVRSGVILNVYKIVDAWESDEPAKITKTNNRVRFQLAECRDYSYLIGSTLKTKTQNPVSSLSLETLKELVK